VLVGIFLFYFQKENGLAGTYAKPSAFFHLIFKRKVNFFLDIQILMMPSG
jgi:hypothetical protein